MKNIKIKNESAIIRCEICHKSDQLDPLTNECLRCKDIVGTKLTKRKANKEAFSRKPDWPSVIFCLVSIALMPFFAVFALYFIYSPLSWTIKFLIFIALTFLVFLHKFVIEVTVVFIRTRNFPKKQ